MKSILKNAPVGQIARSLGKVFHRERAARRRRKERIRLGAVGEASGRRIEAQLAVGEAQADRAHEERLLYLTPQEVDTDEWYEDLKRLLKEANAI